MKNIFKERPRLTIFSFLFIGFDIYFGQLSWTPVVVFVLIMSLLLDGTIKDKLMKKIKILAWCLVSIGVVLTIYVQYWIPHGPMINTGYDCVETNDGRTTECGDQYVEDTRNLRIPDWAKFLRTSESFLLIFALVSVGVIASKKED